MDDLRTLRSAIADDPGPSSPAMARARAALDDRIAGERRTSSIHRRTVLRWVGGIGASVVVGVAATGAAILVASPGLTRYDIGTAPAYQQAFVACMADLGWTDVDRSSPAGPGYVSIALPPAPSPRSADDTDHCRAAVARDFGVSTDTVMGVAR